MTLSQRLRPLLLAHMGGQTTSQDLLIQVPGLKLHGLRHAMQTLSDEIALFAVPDPAARNPMLLVRAAGTACPEGALADIPCGPDTGVLYATTPEPLARRGKAGFTPWHGASRLR